MVVFALPLRNPKSEPTARDAEEFLVDDGRNDESPESAQTLFSWAEFMAQGPVDKGTEVTGAYPEASHHNRAGGGTMSQATQGASASNIQWNRLAITVMTGVGAKTGSTYRVDWHIVEAQLGRGLKGDPVLGGVYTAWRDDAQTGGAVRSLAEAMAALEELEPTI